MGEQHEESLGTMTSGADGVVTTGDQRAEFLESALQAIRNALNAHNRPDNPLPNRVRIRLRDLADEALANARGKTIDKPHGPASAPPAKWKNPRAEASQRLADLRSTEGRTP